MIFSNVSIESKFIASIKYVYIIDVFVEKMHKHILTCEIYSFLFVFRDVYNATISVFNGTLFLEKYIEY